jgi:hypothetical protein
MDQARRQLALVKLWNSFPSAILTGDEKTAAALREWFEIVEPFSSEAIEMGCLDLARRDCAFLPSTGQIFHACEKASADLAVKRRSAIKLIADPNSKIMPKTYLEKWEHERGRLHPDRERVIEAKLKKQLNDAAEGSS